MTLSNSQKKLEGESNKKMLNFCVNDKCNDDIQMVYEGLLSMGFNS